MKSTLGFEWMRDGSRVLAMALAVGNAGCAVTTINTMHNAPLPAGEAVSPTRAIEAIAPAELGDGIFFGIAMSGGGSRAANFSAAVLLELDAAGLLDRATAISSVSGSSLPVAYYGLYGKGRDASRWNPQQVRTQFGKDFETRWISRWVWPQNAVQYWFTNFNRSDIMKEVFDSDLYASHTYQDMGQGLPRILLNSTSLRLGERFVFSEEQFRAIGSRIDTYPIANAVMASAAFPGAFHDMTLYDFADRANARAAGQQAYYHVLDGGPSDNLGTTTLLDMLDTLYRDERSASQVRGCLLLVVDAYPYPRYSEQTTQADTRSAFDFLFDTNVARASDALLSQRRLDLLAQLAIDGAAPDMEPFRSEVVIALKSGRPARCAIWYVGLPRLYSGAFTKAVGGNEKDEFSRVARVVNSIPTRFALTGVKDPGGQSPSSDALQEDLYTAAADLLRLDRDAGGVAPLQRACEWFSAHGAARPGSPICTIRLEERPR